MCIYMPSAHGYNVVGVYTRDGEVVYKLCVVVHNHATTTTHAPTTTTKPPTHCWSMLEEVIEQDEGLVHMTPVISSGLQSSPNHTHDLPVLLPIICSLCNFY